MVPVDAALLGEAPGLLVVLRFRADDAAGTARLLDRLREALAVLATAAGFREGRLTRAIDDPHLVTVCLEWDEVGSYRRALSSYEVKVTVVPLLSLAIDEPSAFEIVHARGGTSRDAVGALAADAQTVRLGEAAARRVDSAPS